MSQPPDSKANAFPRYQRLRLAGLLTLCVAAGYLLLVRKGLMLPPSQIPAALCLPSCPINSIHTPITQAQTMSLEATNLASLQELLSRRSSLEEISVLIEKSAYRLTVFSDLEPVKSYPMVLGYSPEGDKFVEGDRKTPEGIYYIRDLYPHPEWSKFIWLNYPTSQDWREHFREKLAGNIPLSASIGSEVGIHGVLSGADTLIEAGDNWTWGCISLKNADVDELYAFVGANTLVEIVP